MKANDEVTIDMIDHPDGSDLYLELIGPNGNLLAVDDNSGGGLNARITQRLFQTGQYTILAMSFADENAFAYDLRLECRQAGELNPDPSSAARPSRVN